VMQRLRGRGDVVVDDGANGDESRTKAVAAMVVLPTTPTPPSDRLRVLGIWMRASAARSTSYRAPRPLTPIYLTLYSRGPPTINGLGGPDQSAGLKGREIKRSNKPLGKRSIQQTSIKRSRLWTAIADCVRAPLVNSMENGY
jgi:hypothetical protein